MSRKSTRGGEPLRARPPVVEERAALAPDLVGDLGGDVAGEEPHEQRPLRPLAARGPHLDDTHRADPGQRRADHGDPPALAIGEGAAEPQPDEPAQHRHDGDGDAASPRRPRPQPSTASSPMSAASCQSASTRRGGDSPRPWRMSWRTMWPCSSTPGTPTSVSKGTLRKSGRLLALTPISTILSRSREASISPPQEGAELDGVEDALRAREVEQELVARVVLPRVAAVASSERTQREPAQAQPLGVLPGPPRGTRRRARARRARRAARTRTPRPRRRRPGRAARVAPSRRDRRGCR